jgi:hypothetical protein
MKFWFRKLKKALYWVGKILYLGRQYIAAIDIGTCLSLMFIIAAWM